MNRMAVCIRLAMGSAFDQLIFFSIAFRNSFINFQVQSANWEDDLAYSLEIDNFNIKAIEKECSTIFLILKLPIFSYLKEIKNS